MVSLNELRGSEEGLVKRIILSLGLFTAAIWLAYANDVAGDKLTWMSVIPPILAISLVILTRKLLPSLGIGTVVGALIAAYTSGQSALNGGERVFGYVSSALTDSWNLQILTFIPVMMCTVALLIASGGIQAVIKRLIKLTTSRRSTQITTIISGLLLFFDDYANSMVVGPAMRPITDRQRVSRAKLAFLVDATSAPISGLAIVSTWIGYEIGLFNEVGSQLQMGIDGFAMFLDALGYRFYCFMMLGFVLINVLSGREFGPMLKAEVDALKNGSRDLSDASINEEHAGGGMICAILPLSALLISMFAGLWIDGGGMSLLSSNPLALFSISSWREVLIRVDDTITVLVAAAFIGLILAYVCAKFSAKTPSDLMARTVKKTLKECFHPIAILVMAWVLKGVCNDVQTGKFLVTSAGNSVPAELFPALVFLLAGLTSFATGASWGTMAILIPTAIPVAFQLDHGSYGLITMISLGAVLDGAIFGDHCSPISDTTIMSSTASSCDHITHVKTQLPYSMLLGAFALLFGYLPAAQAVTPAVSISLALLASFAVLMIFGKKPEKIVS